MKITKVEIIPVNVPLEQPIGHAFYKRTSGKHMIVKIYDDEGRFGVGCSSVLAQSYCMDNLESTCAKAKEVAELALIGQNPMNTEMILAKIDNVLRFSTLTKAPGKRCR